MVKNLMIKTEEGGEGDNLNPSNLQSSSQLLSKSNLNDPESEKEEGESLNTNDTKISAKSSIEKLLPNLDLIKKPVNTSFPWVHYGNGLFEDDLSLQVFIDQIIFIPNYTKSSAISTEVMGQDNYSKILGFAKVLRKVCNSIELEAKSEETGNNNEGEVKEEDKKLLISSFLPLKQYTNLKEKSYKEDNPILILYKEPNLRLGYKSNWIGVKPSSIQFWDRLDLVPMNNSKQIQYCCLIPQNRDLLLECNNFFNNLKYNFHKEVLDGYLQISRPIAGNGMSQGYNQGGQAQPGGQGQAADMTGGRVNQHQEGITTPQTPGLNQSTTPTQSSQPFDKISKEAILDTYFRHASMLSDELFALNQRDPNQLQQQTPQTIIIFYITYQIPLTYQMLFELSSTLTKSIFKKNNSEANNFKIQLVPLPLEFLLSFRNLEESGKILLNFSLNLYNQVYNLSRGEDDQILKSFQPSYSLVPNLPKKIKFGPDTGEEEFREDKFYCHLSYSLGPNYEYVMVHWSDNVGVNRDFSVIPLPVFNPNKPIPYPLYLHHIWNATQAFVQRSCPWNPDSTNIVYFITKLGKLYKLELEAWRLFWDSTNSLICLFSLLGESQFNCFPNLKDFDHLSVGGIKMSKSGKSMSGSGLNANSNTSNPNIDDFGGEMEEEFGFTGNRNRHLILLPASRYPISPDVIPLLMGVILDLPVVPIGQNQRVRLNTNLTQNFTSPNYCAISDTHLPNSISNQQKTIQLALIYHTKSELQTHEIFKTFLKQTSDLSYLNLDYYLQDPNFQVSKELLKFGEQSNRLGVILDLVGFGCCKLPYNWYLMVKTTIALIEGGVAMGDRYLN
ncbi:hypothetical protein CONCODRAFT_20266 [Conidiobolus coronatus NRRL 28638]|uniref:Mediator of RNA polymerase II transcription subunit 13 n=1 Tax=Conidiobolus coronatus (strain ATCC 28846 / CBS 209.66 / NRRL 28638) TaxID=796925 RepID=A0A137NUU3_CONC2|nr:hypothetical protein CONCODRAFT_20266 [Conidiobolus coronatus NRRL 28638]|eukprot:KXN66374.1 hypothetical protein CONCODRAFT_20266 [Conidiobolus coronatus NRRL 28638]